MENEFGVDYNELSRKPRHKDGEWENSSKALFLCHVDPVLFRDMILYVKPDSFCVNIHVGASSFVSVNISSKRVLKRTN